MLYFRGHYFDETGFGLEQSHEKVICDVGRQCVQTAASAESGNQTFVHYNIL